MNETTRLAEKALVVRYSGKFVKYAPIGKEEIYGRIDKIVVDEMKTPIQALFVIDHLQYREEVDSIDELLTLI